MTGWHKREVTNETDSREINEITNNNLDHLDQHATINFVCECSDVRCKTAVSMTPAEYESVRADGASFALARNHENPEIDMLISEGPRFTVIQKLPGPAARQAIASDPRRIPKTA
jgi:hypothetical protein